VTRADGAKFGKSVDGAVWLGADRTSPYAFYQYWINTDDRDVERFLLQMTLLAVDEVSAVVAAHGDAPHRRDAQRRLAHEVTTLLHGEAAAIAAASASQLLFGGDPTEAEEASFQMLELELEVGRLDAKALEAGLSAADLALVTGLVTSRSDANRALQAGELAVNGRRLSPGDEVSPVDLLHGRYLLVRRGKRRFELVIRA